jgi:hypothetical protein
MKNCLNRVRGISYYLNRLEKYDHPGLNSGLKTTVPRNPGEIIVIYTGRNGLSQSGYSIEFKENPGQELIMLDCDDTFNRSQTRDQLARYINASCSDIYVNCYFMVLTGQEQFGGPVVVVRAKTNIPAGDVLWLDYGKDYFTGGFKNFQCLCPACT